ncbi:hypothetical protein RHMOL_Rhmol04G0105000 [Rhododendron molle]|uniref:Uncharacterized protein n=1 Tax=Rhododendron molle TaxID=49168 RepID=A0ACC0P039_RHOML|nr:hypothetical protein RHMOL_Rhmol04G0105000 [Rhododendron molle]
MLQRLRSEAKHVFREACFCADAMARLYLFLSLVWLFLILCLPRAACVCRFDRDFVP